TIKLISQGEIVAQSLKDYLQRHPEIETKISKDEKRTFYTTDSAEDFTAKASVFFGEALNALHTDLQ
ncbi:MAG: glutamate racemase, partial [Bacteroidota bacterium]|nr:glutamate racemase [Bacteroidota bacterium]